MIDLNFAKSYFDTNRKAILERWFELLRLPTVGADPRRLGDCARAAAWLKHYLRPLGFEVNIMTPPEGLPVPVLLATRPGTRTAASTVLFYGHYDVQPEDPVDSWNTPPFEPTLVDERVYARGAQDNKGQMFAFLEALRAMIEADKPLPHITLIIEGQEESGSTAITALVPEIADQLRADIMMVSDTSAGPDSQPAIVAGLRGIQHLTVTLSGPSYDLHSGFHGGVAPNPAQGMAHLLASLHNPDGSIAVKEFCDYITPPLPEELEAAHLSAISDEKYIEEIGCPPLGGEVALPPVERVGFKPTIEVNGIHTGYGGPGSKTVIPCDAMAKISMRLVPGQVPTRALAAVANHLKEHTPPGMTLTLSELCPGAPGFRLPMNSPAFRIAADVLTRMDERGPLYRWEGGSIPIVATLQRVSGAAPLLVGFGREEDKIHSPNESFGIDQFVSVMTWSTMMLGELT